MKRYVEQLIEDIDAAHRDTVERETYAPKSFEEEMEEVERYISTDPEYTFSQQCGLQREQFPPADRLTDKQMMAICKAFESMMASYNIDATMPEALPMDMAYKTLLSVLDMKVMITYSGFVTIEFCDYEPNDCPFGDYCTCKEFLEELDENDFDIDISDVAEGDLPF